MRMQRIALRNFRIFSTGLFSSMLFVVFIFATNPNTNNLPRLFGKKSYYQNIQHDPAPAIFASSRYEKLLQWQTIVSIQLENWSGDKGYSQHSTESYAVPSEDNEVILEWAKAIASGLVASAAGWLLLTLSGVGL